MQKRRTRASASELPITMPNSTGSQVRLAKSGRTNRQNRSISSFLAPFCLFILFILVLRMILISDFDYVSHHPVKDTTSNHNMTESVLNRRKHNNATLSKFPSLAYALENAELVGLYFAASWCPDSLPVSKQIEEIFSVDISPISHRMLPHQSTESNILPTKKDLALVYVSSDESEKDMMRYIKHNWIPVPFDSPDKTNLKRQFSVCAQREMESLGILKRTQEIPALIILDSETHSVLTVNGKNDVMERGTGALDEWLQLKELVRALSEKYSEWDD